MSLNPLAVTDWIFDLDDTLYPPDCGIMRMVEARIVAYVIDVCGVDAEAARLLQSRYLAEHGTTLAGLMAHHTLDPADFLRAVHEVPLTALEPDPALVRALAALPGQKLVFTNGARAHAARVLERLGLSLSFDGVFAIEDADLVPKPHPDTFARLIRRHGVRAESAVFFEDTARNLEPAHALGMTTVLVGPHALSNVSPHVRYRTPDLTTFLEPLVQGIAA